MKKNIFFFMSVALFVSLFYNQTPGLNLSFFGATVWVFLLAITAPKKRNKQFWLLSAATWVSLIAFAWYADFLSFVAVFFSLLLTGFKAFYPKLNVIIFPFAMAFNYATFIFRVLLPHKWLGFSNAGEGIVKKMISYVLIPGIFVGLFMVVYASASDKFAALFIIDWNFDFFQLTVLTCVAFFLMFNFFYSAVPKTFVYFNGILGDHFSDGYVQKQTGRFQILDIVSQRRSGEITMVLLNLVLGFFIVIYGIEQFGTRANVGSLSADVHERVYVLIFSIVMAIAVIMVFFRGLLNFDARSVMLKTLSYVWIVLNILLIAAVVLKNADYVIGYGLTFKRIGVFVFLLLSLLGLLITSYKLRFIKTNMFLVSRMMWVFFATLVLGCGINWSWMVTKYNTALFVNPDWEYLESLDFNKQILNRIYLQSGKDNSHIVAKIKSHQSKKFLSKSLYYECLNINQ